MSKALPSAIVIMGPTASGKTSLAMALHDVMPCQLISVDSALIYRGMDIGTAKPSTTERKQYPHDLIDIIDPSESYSVAEFRRDALISMENAVASGKTPVLVGGTMMYYKALLEGLSPLPESDPDVRIQIEAEANQFGWQHLHDQLSQFDPAAAQRIHPNDPQRLTRATEVYRLTGESITALQRKKPPPLPYEVKIFTISPQDRSILHDRIEMRFHQMLQQGFQAEVELLHRRGDLHQDLPAIRCVGYRQMWQFLDGELSYDDMVFRGIVATRQLAKRQFTWLKSWQDAIWLDSLADQKQNLTKLLSVSDT